MTLQTIVNNAPYFLLVAARCLALILTTPLLSSSAVSRVAKVALAGCVAMVIFPTIDRSVYNFNPYSLEYVLLLAGEALIGVITGLFVSMIFGAFSSAGQFFSLQMGFSAAEAYDALSQVENPLMGQFLNLVAMLCFLQTDCFKTLFLGGISTSFKAFNSFTLVLARENFINFLLQGLANLTYSALMIALPLMGTLFLISTTMGLLSKAAPQMNLLSEGLPITILVTFLLLTILMPTMINVFVAIMQTAFRDFESLMITVSGGI